MTVALRKQSEVLSFSGAAPPEACDVPRVSIMVFHPLTEVRGSCAVHAANSGVKTIIKKQTRAIASPLWENSESFTVFLPDKPKVSQLHNCIELHKKQYLSAASHGASFCAAMQMLARTRVFSYVTGDGRAIPGDER